MPSLPTTSPIQRLPALIEILYGSAGAKAPTNFPRNDLVAAFLTGVSGLNQPATVTASEMLRLNTTTPAMAWAPRNVLALSAATTPASRMAAAPATTWSTSRCAW
jgi:hypothetical protein